MDHGLVRVRFDVLDPWKVGNLRRDVQARADGEVLAFVLLCTCEVPERSFSDQSERKGRFLCSA